MKLKQINFAFEKVELPGVTVTYINGSILNAKQLQFFPCNPDNRRIANAMPGRNLIAWYDVNGKCTAVHILDKNEDADDAETELSSFDLAMVQEVRYYAAACLVSKSARKKYARESESETGYLVRGLEGEYTNPDEAKELLTLYAVEKGLDITSEISVKEIKLPA